MTVYFVTTDKKTQEDIAGVPHLRPEVLDTIRMEDLIKEYLTSKENVHKIKFCVFSFCQKCSLSWLHVKIIFE